MKRFIKMAFLGTVAATVILGASAAFAEGTTKVDTNGIAFQVPEQLSDLVNVQTENLGEDTLVSVFEKASVEASENKSATGVVAAGYELGVLCELGLGVEQDTEKAIELYQEAAAYENTDALAALERLSQ